MFEIAQRHVERWQSAVIWIPRGRASAGVIRVVETTWLVAVSKTVTVPSFSLVT
jgi:hypothetical protein